MTLTSIQQIRLEIALIGEAEYLLSDEELQYFLDKHNGSIRRAAIDVAKFLSGCDSGITAQHKRMKMVLYTTRSIKCSLLVTDVVCDGMPVLLKFPTITPTNL